MEGQETNTVEKTVKEEIMVDEPIDPKAPILIQPAPIQIVGPMTLGKSIIDVCLEKKPADIQCAMIVARVGEERNDIWKLSEILATELNKLEHIHIDIIPFDKKHLFCPKNLKSYDVIIISNIGLQCAAYCFWKRFGLNRKIPFIAISFGSDIRDIDDGIINLFNNISKSQIKLLYVINPDLEEIAKKRGYKNVRYINNWAEALG